MEVAARSRCSTISAEDSSDSLAIESAAWATAEQCAEAHGSPAAYRHEVRRSRRNPGVAMQTFIVETIDQLTKVGLQIFEATKTRWWFRGQMDEKWPLLPSVRRGYSKQRERYLTNLFYTRARTRYSNCPNDEDFGGWLALMQHYGLPTRLLDWTHSPLIAAYFATKYPFDSGNVAHLSDAAIWALEPHRLNKSQGYAPIFPPLNARSLEALLRPAMKGQDRSKIRVLAASPLETDLKMLTQQGAFTVHVMDKPLNEMPGCDDWLKKLVIPAACVPDVAKELGVLGFRLADLFPDLRNLAREITNMHKPSSA